MIQFYATVSSGDLRGYMPLQSNYMLPASSWHLVNFRKPNLPKTLKGSIAADSGAFLATQTTTGEYPFSLNDYANWLSAFSDQLSWASTLDYVCLPSIGDNPALIRERQERSTYMAWLCWQTCPDLMWCSTIQGQNIDQFVRHAQSSRVLIKEMQSFYQGKKHREHFRIGIGSLIGRPAKEIHQILYHVSQILNNIPIHLFGVKLKALSDKTLLASSKIPLSADSASWNTQGMKRSSLEARAERLQLGMSKMQYAYEVLLPRYETKLKNAQKSPKQFPLIEALNQKKGENP